MSKQATANVSEKVHYTEYYEHDGALRAYSNRMLWFGIFTSLVAFVRQSLADPRARPGLCLWLLPLRPRANPAANLRRTSREGPSSISFWKLT